ncbi:MAG: GNAT family N-acetyltransferase [Alphaproteobacteria bacterium]|nr:GNAT family N-acetyltransferase [Alphaproteobacteria bacterium]
MPPFSPRPIPTFRTLRTHLVAPSLKHVEDVHAYSCDPEFCRFIASPSERSLSDTASFLTGIIEDNAAGRRIYWAVKDIATQKIVGLMGLIFEADCSGDIEIGYGLAREHWGTGLFQECLNEILTFAFFELELSEVVAITIATNVASVRGIEKIGFLFERSIENYYMIEGTKEAAARLVMSRETFAASAANAINC